MKLNQLITILIAQLICCIRKSSSQNLFPYSCLESVFFPGGYCCVPTSAYCPAIRDGTLRCPRACECFGEGCCLFYPDCVNEFGPNPTTVPIRTAPIETPIIRVPTDKPTKKPENPNGPNPTTMPIRTAPIETPIIRVPTYKPTKKPENPNECKPTKTEIPTEFPVRTNPIRSLPTLKPTNIPVKTSPVVTSLPTKCPLTPNKCPSKQPSKPKPQKPSKGKPEKGKPKKGKGDIVI